MYNNTGKNLTAGTPGAYWRFTYRRRITVDLFLDSEKFVSDVCPCRVFAVLTFQNDEADNPFWFYKTCTVVPIRTMFNELFCYSKTIASARWSFAVLFNSRDRHTVYPPLTPMVVNLNRKIRYLLTFRFVKMFHSQGITHSVYFLFLT